MKNKFHSHSSRELKKIAAQIAKKNIKSKSRKNALVLALVGDLGAGKTTFAQGFLRSLGVRNKITSPTFVLIKNYKFPPRADPSRTGKFYKFAYHIDAYRIKKPKELLDLGLKEVFKNPENIVLIEWADRIKKILPKNTIWIKFEHGKKENERFIKITNFK